MVDAQLGKFNDMEKIEISTKKLEIINQWISNCDTKSSFILTFYGVVLTIIFTSTFGSEMVNSFSYTLANKFNGESFGNFVVFLTQKQLPQFPQKRCCQV